MTGINVRGTRCLQESRNGRISLGCLDMDRATVSTVAPALAKAGYDWIMQDLMFGPSDISDIHYSIMAAREAGLGSIVRLPAYPWASADTPDRSLLVHAARIASLNPDGISFSANTVAEVEMVAEVVKDWHRAGHIQETAQELSDHEDTIKSTFIVMPIIESANALHSLEQIMKVPAVNAVLMAGTDLPRHLGMPYQYEHPRVWEFIDGAVAMGRKHGVLVGLNTGYIYTDPRETAGRVRRLLEHGLQFALTQTIAHMLYSYGITLTRELERSA